MKIYPMDLIDQFTPLDSSNGSTCLDGWIFTAEVLLSLRLLTLGLVWCPGLGEGQQMRRSKWWRHRGHPIFSLLLLLFFLLLMMMMMMMLFFWVFSLKTWGKTVLVVLSAVVFAVFILDSTVNNECTNGWRWDFEVEPYCCTNLMAVKQAFRPLCQLPSNQLLEDWKIWPFLQDIVTATISFRTCPIQHSCMWCVGSHLHWGFRVWDANWDKESLRGKVQGLRSIRQFVRKLQKFVKPMAHGFLMDSPGFSMVWPGNGFQFTIWNVRSICTRLWVIWMAHEAFHSGAPSFAKAFGFPTEWMGGVGHKKVQMTR